MAIEMKRLNGAETEEITLIEKNLSFKTGKRATEGKTYSMFRFDGAVFTVPDGNGFLEAVEASDLQWVKLVATKVKKKDADGKDELVDGWQFDSHKAQTSFFARELREAEHIAAILTIKSRVSVSITSQSDASVEEMRAQA